MKAKGGHCTVGNIKPCINNDSIISSYQLACISIRRMQSPRPDVMPDRREGITRSAGFEFDSIDTQAS